MTSEQRLDDLRGMHFLVSDTDGSRLCYEDGDPWPCDEAYLLDRISGLERQVWSTAEGQRATLDQLVRVTGERDLLAAALTGVGHPFRGGPNLCWCPPTWSGPENHTQACLSAFDALAAASSASQGDEGREKLAD